MSYAADAVIETLFERVNEESIEDQMITKGVEVKRLENYELKQTKKSKLYIYIILLVIIIGLIYKFKNHKIVHSTKNKVKQGYSTISPKIKKSVEKRK